MLLRLAHRILAEVKDRGRKHGTGVAVADALDEMIEIADAAGGDHRHRHGVANSAGQRDIKTLPRAVAIHGGEQDFAGAKRNHLFGVGNGVDPGWIAAAVSENLPARRLARLRYKLRID